MIEELVYVVDGWMGEWMGGWIADNKLIYKIDRKVKMSIDVFMFDCEQ